MALEAKKMNLELMRVAMARAELEYKIEENYAEIERLKKSVEAQLKRETELNEKIKELSK